MGWKTALPAETIEALEASKPVKQKFQRPVVPMHKPDLKRIVTVDFETYYDSHFTLRKLSTSEYIRHDMFRVQMVGIKIGKGKTRVMRPEKAQEVFDSIDWGNTALLCHNTQFDGLILSHYYGIVPTYYYDTLSMARGLHSNEIGAGLDDVARYYGRGSKLEGVLETTKAVWEWDNYLFKAVTPYCAQDVDLTFDIFCDMVKKYPADEMDLIDMTVRMFCHPLLLVDTDRVQAEYEREVAQRTQKFYAAVNPLDYEPGGKLHDPAMYKKLLKTKAERELPDDERRMLVIQRVIGSNELFSDLLRAEGVEPPTKQSAAWLKKDPSERDEEDEYGYAFSKTDLEFVNLPDNIDTWRGKLDPNKPRDMAKILAKQDRIRTLVDCRLSVKSTSNITRSERFLEAGKDGMCLPAGYAYYRAHTGRWGGNNKMNMQNLARGGELRLSILAQPGHRLCVVDSGQIEARVNGWLWGQDDLLNAFRSADKWDKATVGTARGDDRDAYCKFADTVYDREITTNDKMERFVGKVCIAEGELVLTHRGLVPIHLISKQDWLWDGVEWVRHAGVIDQGIKEVITYDGLTATSDHEVFTEDGRIIPLGQAASEMARLQRTGAGGQNLRFCDDHVVADTPRKRLSVRQGQMRPDWYYEADTAQQLGERKNDFVFEERSQANTSRGGAGSKVRRHSGAMHEPGKQTLGQLRSARHQVLVQNTHGVHSVGEQELAPRGLHPSRDRQDRQRRALHARQSQAGYTNATSAQPAQHGQDYVERQASSVGRVSEPLQRELDVPADAPRPDWRTTARSVRVYDIANAGPRRRYTVSNTLVLNCVLGLGYQMGAPKFQLTLARGALGGPPVHFHINDCHRIVNAYRSQNYKIKEGWDRCTDIIKDMAAGRQGAWKCLNWEKETIWLPNGMCLKFPDLKSQTSEDGYIEYSYQSGDSRSKLYGGKLCENLVQALARIIVATQMLWMQRDGLRVVMTTHDEAVCMVPADQADAAFALMLKHMTTPLNWCPDIPLAAEGGHDINYSK